MTQKRVVSVLRVLTYPSIVYVKMAFASFGSLPSGDRSSFSAPAGDTTTLNAPGSRQMRARETNGTILIAVTARKSDMDLDGPQWKAFRKNAEKGRYSKHMLRRTGDGKYNTRIEGGGELIGMIERAETSDYMVRFHVTVRGIVSVPLWWFTADEFECRVHATWGPVFSKQHGKSVTRFYKASDRSPGDVQRDYNGSVNKHLAGPLREKCYTCYFRV